MVGHCDAGATGSARPERTLRRVRSSIRLLRRLGATASRCWIRPSLVKSAVSGDEEGAGGEAEARLEQYVNDGGWRADAQRILNDLQEMVSARDLPALLQFFEDPAVLIGTAGDGRTPEAREAYLEAVTTQPAALGWEWRETVLFFESEDALGFAAFGDVVLVDDAQEVRAPIRGTFFAVRANGGWRLRQFHGSIPQSPNRAGSQNP